MRWPTPIRIVEGPIVTYGYEGEVVFLTELTVSEAFAESEIRIVADVEWLVCKNECIPGEATLKLVLPVRDGEDSAGATTIAEARRRLPRALPADALSVASAEKAVVLTLTASAARDLPESDVIWELFPRASRVLASEAEPTVERTATGDVVVTHPLARNRKEPPARFAGVLVARSAVGVQAFAVDAEVAGASHEGAAEEPKTSGWMRFVAVALLGLFVGTMLGRVVLRRRKDAEVGPGKE